MSIGLRKGLLMLLCSSMLVAADFVRADDAATGWTDQNKQMLAEIVARGAEKELPVIFDFDNTLLMGDIGEETFRALVRRGKIHVETLPADLIRPFSVNGRKVEVRDANDLFPYYEALEEVGAAEKNNPSPSLQAYAWLVQVMAGLDVADVLAATEEAAKGLKFHPQMIELVGQFLSHEYQVWIVSASNVWSVRWMVLHVLNDELKQRGFKMSMRPEHVIGISLVMQDEAKQLRSDIDLVRANKAYAALSPRATSEYKLTFSIAEPVSGYYGKVTAIMPWIKDNPYFAAGDSPSDIPLLSRSQNHLWIARLDKPKYQEIFQAEQKHFTGNQSLVQPTRPDLGGFVNAR